VSARTAPPAARAAPPAIARPVFLVRHAATSWTGSRWCGRADPGLTAAGEQAAVEMAADLAARVADGAAAARIGRPVLLVSPARRARQTAAALTAALGVEPTIDDDLVEVDVGACEGLTWEELGTRHPDVAAAIGRGEQPDWPGGESRAEVAERAALVADRIVAATPDATVIAVSHGAILHAIATRLAAAAIVETGSPIPALGPAAILRLDPPQP
jgi:broad specificity phosphatase PhoE